MSDIQTIIQGGAVGIAVFLIIMVIYIVKMFIKYLSKKDEQFGQIISNHINHATASSTKLADTIAELLRFLKNGNGKK